MAIKKKRAKQHAQVVKEHKFLTFNVQAFQHALHACYELGTALYSPKKAMTHTQAKKQVKETIKKLEQARKQINELTNYTKTMEQVLATLKAMNRAKDHKDSSIKKAQELPGAIDSLLASMKQWDKELKNKKDHLLLENLGVELTKLRPAILSMRRHLNKVREQEQKFREELLHASFNPW